tara:strand:+ start:178 stop:1071 length:894 start_codon:yes stop_codon:yes gene_type:complete
MTGAELVDALGRRVEDENDVNFSVAHKLQALNTSHKTLVNLLDNYYLKYLTATVKRDDFNTINNLGRYSKREFNYFFSPYNATGVTATSPTDGGPTVFTKVSHSFVNGQQVQLSGFTEMTDVNGLIGEIEEVATDTFQVKGVLGSPAETTGGIVTRFSSDLLPLRNGIIRFMDVTNNRVAKIVPQKDFPSNENYPYGTIVCLSGLVGGAMSNGQEFQMFKISPINVSSVEVEYLTQPQDIADDSVEASIDDALEPILLDLAEAEIFFADNRQSRGNLAYQRALKQIEILNLRLKELE